MEDTKEIIREALRLTINNAGSQASLAERLGENYSQQQISHWLKVGRIPAEHVLRIEEVSGVTRHRLCPHVFGRSTPCESISERAA